MNKNICDNLLIELFCEELPPKNLKNLSEYFGKSIFAGLEKADLLTKESKLINYATPRRLSVKISSVLEQKEDFWIEKKGPAVSLSFDEKGNPSKALIGFAKSCGVEVSELIKVPDENNSNREVMSAKVFVSGTKISEQIVEILNQAIKSLPVAKNMRWGSLKESFVRPVHKIVLMFGSEVIIFSRWNINSGNQSAGHRFLGKAQINIDSADTYEQQLLAEGSIIASFNKRQEKIIDELNRIGNTNGNTWGNPQLNQNLLDEVTALCEFPHILIGEFSSEFLKVPQEALIVSMTQHQKYFPIFDKNGKITANFLMVANIIPAKDKSEIIVKGNERVLRARLSDAKFFYENDCKTKLEDRVTELNKVTYLQDLEISVGNNVCHNPQTDNTNNNLSYNNFKVGGSQGERVKRIIKIAKIIADNLYLNDSKISTDVELSAKLAKADLVSGLVGEFPELQGIAGYYYAINQGLNTDVATAIREHYLPKFSGDILPKTKIGQVVALADKLESIAGIFGIGKIPTGDKDPFGLRRQALGIIRILIEEKIPLDLSIIYGNFSEIFSQTAWKNCQNEVHNFIIERLRNYLKENYPSNLVESVVANNPTYFADIVTRITALKLFLEKPSANSLIVIGKRIRNIIKNQNESNKNINDKLIAEPAEKNLYALIKKHEQNMQEKLAQEKFNENLDLAITFEEPLAKFFDEVIVMTEDINIRNNRLAILQNLDYLINGVGKISEIVI